MENIQDFKARFVDASENGVINTADDINKFIKNL